MEKNKTKNTVAPKGNGCHFVQAGGPASFKPAGRNLKQVTPGDTPRLGWDGEVARAVGGAEVIPTGKARPAAPGKPPAPTSKPRLGLARAP